MAAAEPAENTPRANTPCAQTEVPAKCSNNGTKINNTDQVGKGSRRGGKIATYQKKRCKHLAQRCEMCAVFQKVLRPSCIVTGQCLNPSSGVVVCHAEQPSILGAQCDPPLMRQCPAAWMDQDQTRDERHTIENKGQVGAMWVWGSEMGVEGTGGQSTAGPAWHKINHLFQGKQASHCPFEVLAMRARIQWRDREKIPLPVDASLPPASVSYFPLTIKWMVAFVR